MSDLISLSTQASSWTSFHLVYTPLEFCEVILLYYFASVLFSQLYHLMSQFLQKLSNRCNKFYLTSGNMLSLHNLRWCLTDSEKKAWYESSSQCGFSLPSAKLPFSPMANFLFNQDHKSSHSAKLTWVFSVMFPTFLYPCLHI